MHPSPAFAWNDRAEMLAFIAEIAWTRIFAATPAGLCVAHVPVVATPDGCLRFHMADANAMTPHMDGLAVLAVVEGPSAYLSGNWHAGRAGVPTWNYVAVECEGVAVALDRADTAAAVDDLARILEPRVDEDWTRAKIEPRRFDAMLDAITGFELRIGEMRGTRKLSQNQPIAGIAGVLAGLEAREELAIVAAMRGVRA